MELVRAVTNVAFPRAYALLIGVADYRSVRKLPSAVVNDVEDIAAILQSPMFCGYDHAKVRVLRDEQATKSAVLAELDSLARIVSQDDTVFVYFSGHGWRHPGADESLLMPVEASISDPTGTMISASTFSDKLHAIGAARLTVFLDACHAGGAGIVKDDDVQEHSDERLGITEKSLDTLSRGSGRAIIASSKLDEKSEILPRARNSAFTTALLEGLRGAADYQGDGAVKLFGLFEFVAERVPTLTGGRQHPLLRTKVENNFTLALNLSGSKNAFDGMPTGSPTLRNRLKNLLPILYPLGPVDHDIWERAGGDLSRLNLAKSGRSIWFEALTLLDNGGGGDLTAKSLISEALADFPSNQSLLALS